MPRPTRTKEGRGEEHETSWQEQDGRQELPSEEAGGDNGTRAGGGISEGGHLQTAHEEAELGERDTQPEVEVSGAYRPLSGGHQTGADIMTLLPSQHHLDLE